MMRSKGPLQCIARCAWLTAQWLAHEFLAISPPALTVSNLASGGCRLLGCAVTLLVTHVELRGGVMTGLLVAVAQLALEAITAILIGNIAKECAFALCEAIVTASGRTFSRTGVTLSGGAFSETHYPNGTWLRCESGDSGTVCDWTDSLGGCNRVEIRRDASLHESLRLSTARPERAWRLEVPPSEFMLAVPSLTAVTREAWMQRSSNRTGGISARQVCTGNQLQLMKDHHREDDQASDCS